jgi:hypothetical protein
MTALAYAVPVRARVLTASRCPAHGFNRSASASASASALRTRVQEHKKTEAGVLGAFDPNPRPPLPRSTILYWLAALIMPLVSPITSTATPPATPVWRPPSTAQVRAVVFKTARACGAGSRHWMAPVSVYVRQSSITVAYATLIPATTTRAAPRTTHTGMPGMAMAALILPSVSPITSTATPPATPLWRAPSTARVRAAVCQTVRACGAGPRYWIRVVNVYAGRGFWTHVACATRI